SVDIVHYGGVDLAVRAKRAHELDNHQFRFYIIDLKRLHRLQTEIFLRWSRIRGGKGEVRGRELFRMDGTKSPVRLQKNKRADNNLKNIDASPLFHLFSPCGARFC